MVDVGFNGYQPGQSPSDRRAAFDLRRQLRAMEQRLAALEANVDVPWRNVGTGGEPAFEDSWVNFETTFTPDAGFFQRARFRKVGDIVQIQGLVKSGTITGDVFTLPAGYRPRNRLVYGTDTGTGHGRIDVIDSTGEVRVISGGNTYVSLNLPPFSVLL